MHMGGPEALVVVAIILVLFGPKRLPDVARGIGKSIVEFRKGAREDAPAEHDKE